jgi:5-methylcytosine-specific restriction endonuclease McrA
VGKKRYNYSAHKRLRAITKQKASQQGWRCYYCGEKFTDKLKPTGEHLIPHSEGGGINDWNIVAACGPCNQGRHAPARKYKFKRVFNTLVKGVRMSYCLIPVLHPAYCGPNKISD